MELVVELKNKRQKKIQATKKAVAKRLAIIMRKHIGYQNAVKRDKLFEYVYGINPMDINELQEIALWAILKSALHYLRQRTKCFITNKRTKGGSTIEYFVVKDNSDAQCYTDIVNKITTQMRQMEKRAYKAVREEWWKYEWIVE
jgi:hypothetical protein